MAVRARAIWVLIDGIGDVGLPAAGKRTPLQVCMVYYRVYRATEQIRGVYSPPFSFTADHRHEML